MAQILISDTMKPKKSNLINYLGSLPLYDVINIANRKINQVSTLRNELDYIIQELDKRMQVILEKDNNKG